LRSSSGRRLAARCDVPTVGMMLWTLILEIPIWSRVDDINRKVSEPYLKRAQLIVAESEAAAAGFGN
jgi:hypothetical protein